MAELSLRDPKIDANIQETSLGTLVHVQKEYDGTARLYFANHFTLLLTEAEADHLRHVILGGSDGDD